MLFPHIIWRGKGWVIVLIVFGCSLIGELTSEFFTRDETFYQTSPYPLAVALFISGLITFYAVNKLEEMAAASNTPQRKNTLFFIPVRYWGWLLIFFSMLALILRKYGV